MMLVGNIPINRSGREKAQRMVTEASQTAINKRQCVWHRACACVRACACPGCQVARSHGVLVVNVGGAGGPRDSALIPSACAHGGRLCGAASLHRYSVVIAPEGTRSWDGHLSIPMKKGTFHIQRATAAAILPVVLHGAYDVWPRGTVFPHTGEITLRHLRPVPFDASRTHDDVRLDLQRQYLDALYPTTPAGIKALPRFKKLSGFNAFK